MNKVKHLYKGKGTKQRELKKFKREYGSSGKRIYGAVVGKVKREQEAKKQGKDNIMESRRKRSAAAKKGWRTRRAERRTHTRRRKTRIGAWNGASAAHRRAALKGWEHRRLGANIGSGFFSMDTDTILNVVFAYLLVIYSPTLVAKFTGFGASSPIEETLVGAIAAFGVGSMIGNEEIKNAGLGIAAASFIVTNLLSGLFTTTNTTSTSDYLKLPVSDYVTDNLPVPHNIYAASY